MDNLTHKDLDVWKGSVEFVTRLYEVSGDFPTDEKYGLVSQLRRAAVSVPANISEGAARGSIKEYVRFCYISLGSMSEIDTLLLICKNLNLVSHDTYLTLSQNLEVLMKQLLNFIKYLKKKM